MRGCGQGAAASPKTWQSQQGNKNQVEQWEEGRSTKREQKYLNKEELPGKIKQEADSFR